jgi:hypothetical protein
MRAPSPSPLPAGERGGVRDDFAELMRFNAPVLLTLKDAPSIFESDAFSAVRTYLL